MGTLRQAQIFYKDVLAGILLETKDGYFFQYDRAFLEKRIPISVSLPYREEPYQSKELFPFFKGLLPEGWYLNIVSAAQKIDSADSFGLLLACASTDTIGAVTVRKNMIMDLNEKFLKKMFNTPKIPFIDFGLGDISRKAQELAGKLSISGVQPKLSVKLDKKQNMLIPVAEGGKYILKPQTPTFLNIPENEQCCMDIAEELNIAVPPHCLLPLKDKSLSYLAKRFDRENGGKIHQEDFGQILEQTDKYKGSVEQIGKKLQEISSAPGYDVQLLFERVILNFILGNGDAHLKNYSIAYKKNNDIRLTPAYDIVCSKLVLPQEEDSAIAIRGKKNKLLREDFDKLADYFNIPLRIRYEKFGKKFDVMRKIIETSSITKTSQRQFLEIIQERINRLGLPE